MMPKDVRRFKYCRASHIAWCCPHPPAWCIPVRVRSSWELSWIPRELAAFKNHVMQVRTRDKTNLSRASHRDAQPINLCPLVLPAWHAYVPPPGDSPGAERKEVGGDRSYAGGVRRSLGDAPRFPGRLRPDRRTGSAGSPSSACASKQQQHQQQYLHQQLKRRWKREALATATVESLCARLRARPLCPLRRCPSPGPSLGRRP